MTRLKKITPKNGQYSKEKQINPHTEKSTEHVNKP